MDIGVELCVYFILVLVSQLLVNVDGVMNVVMVYSDVVGFMLYYGLGVGVELIVLVVVVDVVDVVCVLIIDLKNWVFYLVFCVDSLSDLLILLIEEVEMGYYLCMYVKDQLGVMVKIVLVLSKVNINIEVIIQKDQVDDISLVLLIMLVCKVIESEMNVALDMIWELDVLVDDIV